MQVLVNSCWSRKWEITISVTFLLLLFMGNMYVGNNLVVDISVNTQIYPLPDSRKFRSVSPSRYIQEHNRTLYKYFHDRRTLVQFACKHGKKLYVDSLDYTHEVC